jgi:ADP-ribose diphosphatase
LERRTLVSSKFTNQEAGMYQSMQSGEISRIITTPGPGAKKPVKAACTPKTAEVAAPAPNPTEMVEISAPQPVVKEAPAETFKAAPAEKPMSEARSGVSGDKGPLFVEDTKAEIPHSDNIDGFLSNLVARRSMTKIAKSDMLVTKETKFPSLEHGTRHNVSRTKRPEVYPDRALVPDSWGGDYKPIHFTAPKVEAQPVWAEKTDFQEALALRAEKAGLDSTNLSDKDVARLYPSYEGSIIVDGKPQNPRGPTGLTGQGVLGDHGENTAADPVVFRRQKDPETGETKLQMIAIQRKDNGKWAIPGGMTDYGEAVSGTLSRELREEALGENATEDQKKRFDTELKAMFEQKGSLEYQGAVDDERNTDTSWMATKVVHMEMTREDAASMGWEDMKLTPGDDAKEAKWMDVTADNLAKLNANHGDFVGKSVQSWQEKNGMAVRKDGVIGTPG